MSDIMDTTSKAASAAEATDLIKNGYLIAAKSVQDYNTKLLEFAHTNTKMAFDFPLTLSGVKSPSELMGLATEHAREQFEVLSQQIKELAGLGQRATLATTEPFNTDESEPFTQTT
jgi:hypothetical protein